jgi:hypothetical protein
MAKIAILTVPTPEAWIIINALVERFGPVTVIAEERQGKLDLIMKRMKRLGPITVLGQIGFVLLQSLIGKRSNGRINQIIAANNLDPDPNASCTVLPVGSVNAMACRAALAMVKPDVVVVIGTRIIGRQTLDAINVPLINCHSGINPKYRGQAGGYWARAMGDPENAGVTVHLVDKGVDTGAVLFQNRVEATTDDTFSSIYFLQAAAIRPLAVKAVEDALSDSLKPIRVDLPSQQYFHPTLWFYLWTGWTKGVW